MIERIVILENVDPVVFFGLTTATYNCESAARSRICMRHDQSDQ